MIKRNISQFLYIIIFVVAPGLLRHYGSIDVSILTFFISIETPLFHNLKQIHPLQKCIRYYLHQSNIWPNKDIDSKFPMFSPQVYFSSNSLQGFCNNLFLILNGHAENPYIFLQLPSYFFPVSTTKQQINNRQSRS